jgi:hypothetical protein
VNNLNGCKRQTGENEVLKSCSFMGNNYSAGTINLLLLLKQNLMIHSIDPLFQMIKK